MIQEKIDKESCRYADNAVMRALALTDATLRTRDKQRPIFDAYDLETAFEQGAKFALSNQWISVEGELPENEQYVLVCYKDTYGFGFGVAGYFDNEWYTADENLKIDKIVAWMPIPPLPNARKETVS